MAYVDIEKRATRTNSSTESLKQKGESKTSLLRKSWLFHFFFFFSFQSYINHLLQFRICHVTPKTEIRRRCQNLSSFFVKRDDLKYFAVAGSAGEDSVLCNCLWAAWSRQQLRFLKRGTRHRNLISTLISLYLLFFSPSLCGPINRITTNVFMFWKQRTIMWYVRDVAWCISTKHFQELQINIRS